MSRKFIAAALIVSTTIAAFSAAPARAASDEDIAKILGAAATIFIIGKAIESSRSNDSDKKTKKVVIHNNKHVAAKNRSHIPTVVPREHRPRHKQVALPRNCVRKITGGDVRRVIMKPCLRRNNVRTDVLPRACRITVATNRGHRQAYKLPCLRNRGYTLARN